MPLQPCPSEAGNHDDIKRENFIFATLAFDHFAYATLEFDISLFHSYFWTIHHNFHSVAKAIILEWQLRYIVKNQNLEWQK